MTKPIKAIKFSDLVKDLEEKKREMIQKLKDNGGMCLRCGKHPNEEDSELNTFHCAACNKEAEEILKKLRGPGFGEFRI